MASAQNTLIMMPGDIMKSLSIKPSLIDELVYCSEETGISLSKLFNEALDGYCECHAPVLTQSAQRRRRQKG